MRSLSVPVALRLIVGGAALIAALALAMAFLPNSLPIHVVAFTIVGVAGLLIFLGLTSFRLQGVAWKALADHLGTELLNLEAINTTVTDHVLAFDTEGVAYTSPGLAAFMGLPRVSKPEDLAACLSEGQSESYLQSVTGLADAGEQFSRTFSTLQNRQIEVSGHRAAVRKGQPALYVLRLRDITAEQEALRREQAVSAAALAERGIWQQRLAALPFPVWLRGADLSLQWLNSAALTALELDLPTALSQQKELFNGTLGEDGRWLAEQAQLDLKARTEMAHGVVGGQRRYFAVTEVPLESKDTAFVGYAVDMTQLEEKESELRRHIAGNAAVLERLGSGIAIYGADQKLKFYNQSFVDLWGLREPFLRGEPTLGEVIEELRSERRLSEQADFRRYREDQLRLFTTLLEPLEELQYLPDGRMLRALVAPHPLGGLLFLYEDVSRRFELETSYNTLLAVQRESLNNLAEGICVYGSDGRLKLYNPAFARIWNLDIEVLEHEPHASDVLSRLRPFFAVSEEEWPNLLRDMVAVSLDRNPRSGRLERADSSVLDYLGLPLPDGAVLHSFLDISDSVRVEQALRESNDALEAADRLKSEFIANITYQLRTPLTAIMGFTEILQNQYFGPINDRQRDYCDNILEAGKRLVTLINDILELATIEAGYINLDREDVTINDMLHGVADVVSDWARQEDLELEVNCPETIGTAPIDERRIRQALFNLLSNAIKFTPAGGRIRLTASRTANELELVVADNGIGISSEDQSRIFKRFERANIRTGQTGAGLGLSVVKSIIEMHGGRIEIDSAPNRGTTVRCHLPLTVGAPQPSLLEQATN
jgi:signal transduction histidine kinase